MTEAEKREKVIKGLEICSAGEWNSTGGRDHTDCPYYPAGYTGCTCKLLMRDALALLKAQEPRVMTLEEVRKAVFMYIETRSNACSLLTPAMVTAALPNEIRVSFRFGTRLIDSVILCSHYMNDCRCWTSRPTDEQREATPWNGQA